MVTTDNPAQAIDIVACLLTQNHYQRLGLKSNLVSTAEISQAYEARLHLLKQCACEVSLQELEIAGRLISEAHTVLADADRRERYDQALMSTTMQPSLRRPPKQTEWATRYQIRNLLAEGERSRIFEAIDTRLQRKVIVKRIRGELTRTAGYKTQFEEQVKLFASCNGGNLVKILDYDVQSGSMVLERMAGDLACELNERGLNHQRARVILQGALQGLAFLHSHGIAHGRVELAHLLIDDVGGVKLAVTPGMTGQATALLPSSKVCHLAPELLNPVVFGSPKLAIDLYALGFVVLELLGGKRLAAKISPTLAGSADPQQWLLWHASPTDRLPELKALIPGIPEDLERILNRLTSKQQHERYTNAQECIADLNQTMSSNVTVQSGDSAASNTGVEIYGAPPPLHPEYDHEEVVTWSMIFKQPSLLLEGRGRSHVIQLALMGLLILAALLFIVSPNPSGQQLAGVMETSTPDLQPPWIQEQSDSVGEVEPTPVVESSTALPEAPLAEAVMPEGLRVRFNVIPAGKVISVENYSPLAGTPELWPLDAGTHKVTCQSGSGSWCFDVTVVIPRALGELTCDIHAPVQPLPVPQIVKQEATAPVDPYADVRGKLYFPELYDFPLCGAGNSAQRVAQERAIHQALALAQVRPAEFIRGQYPYALSNSPVDPRASFAIALLAYRNTDRNLARQMCKKSLADAKHFDVPFVIPLRLLNYMQLQSDEFDAAFGDLRSTMQWLGRHKVHDDRHFAMARDEVAWWAGIVIGYIDGPCRSVTARLGDFQYTLAVLGEFCKPEQTEKYRIARCGIDELYRKLDTRGLGAARDLATYQSSQVTMASMIALRSQEEELFARTDLHPETEDHRSLDKERNAESYKTDPQRDSVPRWATVRVHFSQYYVCDVVALAEQAQNTVIPYGT